MSLKNLLKKFHSDKGLTGADVAVAISVIIVTIGVVTAIYVNSNNKSKENIRYSASTRIATQIVENIQSMTYDELVYRCDNSLNTSSSEDDDKIFGVSVPTGYSAEVLAPEISSGTLDVVRDVTVNVSYTISNTIKTITLYTTKEKELLEQTNEPNVNLIDGYNTSNYYAVKYTGSSYLVTATSDPDWYKYDDGEYALIFYSANSYEYGDTISTGTVTAGNVYVWVPRFGLYNNELAYCYGTSSYKISFALFDNSLYGYMLTGIGSGDDYTVDEISGYIDNTFTANDGLSGIWYMPNGTNKKIATNAFTTLNSYIAISNF